MVKRGWDLFTTTGQIMEDRMKYVKCYTCSLCTTPCLCLCMFICKYRSAIFGEYMKDKYTYLLSKQQEYMIEQYVESCEDC